MNYPSKFMVSPLTSIYTASGPSSESIFKNAFKDIKIHTYLYKPLQVFQVNNKVNSTNN